MTPERRLALSRRLRNTRKERKLARERAERLQQMIAMSASGMSTREIGAELNISGATVSHHLSKPEVKQDLMALRQQIREEILRRAAGGVISEAFNMARDNIKTRDAKSFDATTRGWHALEKMTASASGEAQRVQVEHSSTTPLVDLSVLIQQVIGGPRG